MSDKTLAQAVAENPFDDYQTWWPMGASFIRFMAGAIVSEWRALPHQTGDLATVRDAAATYLQTVYRREMAAGLVDDFVAQPDQRAFASGEFDALSYAFYRASFEQIAAQPDASPLAVALERRQYTVRVGARFFQQVQASLQLALPAQLDNAADLAALQAGIDRVGQFLREQGYLRDHFAFGFDVDATHRDTPIRQRSADCLHNLAQNGLAYALYEMGYPVILPSAVYLYNTLGEAQHHSSRTIEELFQRVGYRAAEVPDFDPTGYPSDKVVELWEIRPA